MSQFSCGERHFDDSVAYNLTVRSFQSISGKLKSPAIRNTAFLNSVCTSRKELASRNIQLYSLVSLHIFYVCGANVSGSCF